MIWIFGLVAVLFGFAAFTGAPYVPSKRSDVRRALTDLYPLGKDDVLVDIGSGDGLVLRIASELGAKAIGYEINPVLVFLSKWLSRSHNGVKIYLGSFWKAKLPEDTTVIYTFGDSRDINKMTAKAQETADSLGRPIGFISYAFEAHGRKYQKKLGAHYLYVIEPLQIPRA